MTLLSILTCNYFNGRKKHAGQETQTTREDERTWHGNWGNRGFRAMWGNWGFSKPPDKDRAKSIRDDVIPAWLHNVVSAWRADLSPSERGGEWEQHADAAKNQMLSLCQTLLDVAGPWEQAREALAAAGTLCAPAFTQWLGYANSCNSASSTYTIFAQASIHKISKM
jgi:hypothetical protein